MFSKKIDEIFTTENLSIAYNKLKKTSLGLDGLSLKDIKEHSFLENIKKQILSNSYTPNLLEK